MSKVAKLLELPMPARPVTNVPVMKVEKGMVELGLPGEDQPQVCPPKKNSNDTFSHIFHTAGGAGHASQPEEGTTPPTHVRLPPFSRTVPLLVADDCFVMSSRHQDLLVLMVARVCSSRATYAIPCNQKGHDDYAVSSLAAFVKKCGISRMVYMRDRESSINAMGATLRRLDVDGQWAGAAPEHSAAGESQSNGRAEMAVQTAEDQLRTLNAAREWRIGAEVPSTHPVRLWLAECNGVVLTKYSIDTDGTTPYEDVHCKMVLERIMEFGEHILYHVQGKQKANLDLRWAPGIFLGSCLDPNEYRSGMSNGNATRSSSIVRLSEGRRWIKAMVEGIVGTQLQPNPLDELHDLDSTKDPHGNFDDAGQINDINHQLKHLTTMCTRHGAESARMQQLHRGMTNPSTTTMPLSLHRSPLSLMLSNQGSETLKTQVFHCIRLWRALYNGRTNWLSKPGAAPSTFSMGRRNRQCQEQKHHLQAQETHLIHSIRMHRLLPLSMEQPRVVTHNHVMAWVKHLKNAPGASCAASAFAAGATVAST